MIGGIFQPTIWTWLFGAGIGTNLGASLVWVVLAAGAATLLWPPLRRRIRRFADRKLALLHAHAAHQTRVIEDHYERAFGEKHPHAGRLGMCGMTNPCDKVDNAWQVDDDASRAERDAEDARYAYAEAEAQEYAAVLDRESGE